MHGFELLVFSGARVGWAYSSLKYIISALFPFSVAGFLNPHVRCGESKDKKTEKILPSYAPPRRPVNQIRHRFLGVEGLFFRFLFIYFWWVLAGFGG